jgi:membrane-bound ClpP family serine protease
MTDWYDGLSGVQQFLFVVALFSTLIFALQFLLSMFGIDGDDMDGSPDGGLSLGDAFTVRNGVSFLMGFSWGGLMAISWGLEHVVIVGFIGVVLGSLLVAFNMLLMFGMSKIRHQGNIRLENAINQPARVSLKIPAGRSGTGKVTLSIQGRLKELHAVTPGDALVRNTSVRVTEVEGDQLVVEAE